MKYIKQLFIAGLLLITLVMQAFAAPLGLSTAVRDSRANTIVTAIGNGGKVAFYNGTQPATCGTATTELYRGTLGTPSGTVTGGVLTFNVPADTAASTTGTATWGRFYNTDGTTCVVDFTVSATGGGGTVTINSTSLTSGVNVHFNSFVLTEGGQ